jgi:hypothetical protein
MFGAHLAPTGGAAGGTTMKGKGRVLLHGKRAGEMTWMLKDFDLTAGRLAHSLGPVFLLNAGENSGTQTAAMLMHSCFFHTHIVTEERPNCDGNVNMSPSLQSSA